MKAPLNFNIEGLYGYFKLLITIFTLENGEGTKSLAFLIHFDYILDMYKMNGFSRINKTS